MGLVDPDSTTQDWDTMRTKVTNGKTMLSIWSWLGKPRMNSDENKAKGVGFMLAPLENMKVYSDGFQPDGDGATIVAIGSKAKNKARLAKFIDWMYSPEGIYASSSNSGGAACPKDLGCFTTDKDGKNPTLTKFGQQAMTGDHANLKVSAKLGGSSYDDGYSKLNFKAVSRTTSTRTPARPTTRCCGSPTRMRPSCSRIGPPTWRTPPTTSTICRRQASSPSQPVRTYTTPQEDSTVSATRSSVKSETVNASWQAITAAGKFRRPLTKPAPRSTTSATRKSSRSTSRTPRT